MRYILPLMFLAAIALAQTARAEIYTWVDDKGRTHYTDSYYEVPERYRDQIADIGGELEEQSRLSVIEGLNSGDDAGQAAPHKAEPEGFLSQMEQALEKQAQGGGAPKVDMSAVTGLGLAAIAITFLVALPIALALGAGLLKLSCGLAGEEPIGMGKAMLVVFMQSIAGGIAGGSAQMVALVDPTHPGFLMGGLALSLIASVLAYAAVLRGMHCETFGAALKVTAVTFVVSLVIGIGGGVVLALGGALLA